MKFASLMRFNKVRFWVVKYRYRFLKNNIKFLDDGSHDIGKTTVKHNLTAFNTDSAFGCGGRMGLLVFPVIAFNTFYTIDRAKLKILIVGCRTEDDIYWMKAYGFENTLGLDLFSYSKNILIGDIHHTNFADEAFDVVLLGWMISYTSNPDAVIKECRRITKKGGLLGIGIEHDPTQDSPKDAGPRVNTLNSTDDLTRLLDRNIRHKILFQYDHCNDAKQDFSSAIVSICQ